MDEEVSMGRVLGGTGRGALAGATRRAPARQAGTLRRTLAIACALAAATLGCIIDFHVGSEPQAVVVAVPTDQLRTDTGIDLRVPADQAWTDTGIDVRSGERLQIDYLRGTWSPWAGGAYDAIGSGGDPRCDCNQMAGVSHAALLGRIEGSQPFYVGDHWDQVVGEAGRLFLGINDTRLSDNSGWLEVGVQQGD